MENEKKEAEEFLTVGELARRMNVSVRTLQYYDREGLLPPSAMSEGGRRLYTYRDMVRLHQILSLKQLGFPLAEIRSRLLSLEDPAEVAEMLDQQAEAVRAQIGTLTKTLHQIEALRDEAREMGRVDFSCYADIVVNLDMGNSMYWALKYVDDETRSEWRTQFDRESGTEFLERMQALHADAAELEKQGLRAQSAEAKALGARFWEMVQDATGGDAGRLEKLLAMKDNPEFMADWSRQETGEFLTAALGAYLAEQGIDPFEGSE